MLLFSEDRFMAGSPFRPVFCLISIPSFNKDTHAFRQRKSALTASSRRRGLRFMSGRYSYGIGTPPTLRRSASPHEVLRPCGDPAAAYASMPASSSLSSSGFPSPKSPSEFLRGRNGVRGSVERQAGWRLSTRRAMSGGYLCPQKPYVLLSSEGMKMTAY